MMKKLSMAWMGLMSVAAHAAWEASPREVSTLAPADLPTEIRAGLGDYLVFPPVETGDESFRRGLTLRTIHVGQVRGVDGLPVQFDRARFLRATEAYRILAALRSSPGYAAFEQQAEVVRWLERKLEFASPEERPTLEQEQLQARAMAKKLSENMQPLVNQPMQLAILRRAYRALATDGAPDFETFTREWPQWMAHFLNQDFVQLRLGLDTELKGEDLSFLERAAPYLGGFEFVPGRFVRLHARPPAHMSDIALMQRARVEETTEGHELVLSLNFAGTESLFSEEEKKTVLPFNLAAEVEGGGGEFTLESVRSALCLTSKRVSETTLTAAPCQGGAQ